MGQLELERSVATMIALTCCFRPQISSHPRALETDQELPLSLQSRSITSRRNPSGGIHWSPKAVPFLAGTHKLDARSFLRSLQTPFHLVR